MPETTYMARDERRDHGFTIPDPQLTKEHGIPNACNRCHSDKTVDWSIEWTQKWYGEKLNRPSRDRARLVARARDGDPDVWREIVKFAATEKNPAWIAVLINVLEPANAEPEVIAFLQQNASHADPLVRTAAVGVLATGPGAHPALETALSDANRNVRMTSAYALATSPRPIPADHRKELEQYLANQSDQPGGAMRQANLAAMEERVDDARTWLTRAAKMDPSTGIHDRTARILYTINDLPGARAAFQRAISGESPSSESFYSFALLEAEAGNEEESIRLLRECVTRDPTFGRAWYNLSLAEAGRNNLRQAIPAMEKAVMLSPRDPSPSYALATLHLRMQNPDAALAAAKRALEISPTHGEAKRLVEQLSRE
jgi:tetratricopeptide (TPR) repeat protein